MSEAYLSRLFLPPPTPDLLCFSFFLFIVQDPMAQDPFNFGVAVLGSAWTMELYLHLFLKTFELQSH